MEIVNGTSLSNLCDYSFGDHLGHLDPVNIPGGFMKDANDWNTEFLNKANDFEGKIMTLFIDNIRLYNRPIWANAGNDAEWVGRLLSHNDLLALCAKLINNRFIIFCSHEDTPIDDYIKIPPNILGIHAVNAAYFNSKIHPFPYGLQRKFKDDDRLEIMKETVEKDEHQEPTKLLYINCGIERHPSREYLVNFQNKAWATCRFDKDSKFFPYSKYREFLTELKDHKFMICPQGHGMDCHRNWESLYLRRVPVMLDHPYFRELMKGFPVLFVDDWRDIDDNMLKYHNYLYQEAQEMSLKKLDLNLIFDAIVQSYA